MAVISGDAVRRRTSPEITPCSRTVGLTSRDRKPCGPGFIAAGQQPARRPAAKGQAAGR